MHIVGEKKVFDKTGANPKIVSYSNSAVKIYVASSLVRLKKYFLSLWKNALAYHNTGFVGM
jgi:hypothetical protein